MEAFQRCFSVASAFQRFKRFKRSKRSKRSKRFKRHTVSASSMFRCGKVQTEPCSKCAQEPCCASEFLAKRVMQDMYNFTGYVQSDCGAVNK